MIRKFTLVSYKKYISTRQKREKKKVSKRKLWISRKRKKQQGKSKGFLKWRKEVDASYKIKAPLIFSLSDNTNEVLKFITKVKNSRRNKKIFIELKDVTNITSGSIAMLLSVLKELKENKVRVSGDYPKNIIARKVLDQSGFFTHVIGNIEERNRSVTVNTILTEGKEVVQAEHTAPLVTQAMNTIFGTPYRNQPLQGLIVELMANTVNHAFPQRKNRCWWLSVNHDIINKKVSFSFVDNGVGIVETLRLKLGQKLKKIVVGESLELLQSAFMGKIGSRTKLVNRGKGLPSIYRRHLHNDIKKLTVITNGVFLDFDNKTSTNLKNEFDGTYYHWEVDLNCTAWKNI